MKIVSFNTWHGTCKSELRTFLLSQLKTVDVFCLQEADGDNIEAIINELFADNPDFYLLSSVKTMSDSHHHYYCLYTIVKKPLTPTYHLPLLDQDDSEVGQALAVELNVGDRQLVIVNVHGMPYPGDKLDTDGRLRQTRQIVEWLHLRQTPAIVCGDFNLQPETKSVQDFSAAGYQDLIQHYGITTTRNQLAWQKWPDNVQYYADYTFVSPNLTIKDFSVPDMEVSDHLPMVIDVA